jgi:hypothetical protein
MKEQNTTEQIGQTDTRTEIRRKIDAYGEAKPYVTVRFKLGEPKEEGAESYSPEDYANALYYIADQVDQGLKGGAGRVDCTYWELKIGG